MKINETDKYIHDFRFTQSQVDAFASLTGDENPIHINAAYASKTIFKKPVVHGILSSTLFSKIIGMDFPGEGSIYLSQTLAFKRPMFVDVNYQAVVEVKSVNRDKGTATLRTYIIQKDNKKITLDGEAEVLNKQAF